MTHNTGDPKTPKTVQVNVLNQRRPTRRIPKTITVFDGYTNSGGKGDAFSSNVGILCDLNVSNTSLFPKNKHAPKSLVIESLIEQLCSFLEKDQRKQKRLFRVICNSLSDWKVLDSKFHNEATHGIRLQFRIAFEKYITQMKDSIQQIDQPNEYLLSITIPEWDRKESLSSCLYQNCYPNTHCYEYTKQYERDFVELDIIDKGAFGIVYKAMKKVEKVEYAVKKIPFSCDKEDPLLPNVLREVQVFAKLSHSNVVNYKTAWIEPAIGDLSAIFVSSNETSSDTLEISSKNQKSVRSSPILEEDEEENLTRSDSLGFETSNLNGYNLILNDLESLQLSSRNEKVVTTSSIKEEQEIMLKRSKNDSFSIEGSKLSNEEYNSILDQMVERYDSGEFTVDFNAGFLSTSGRNRNFSGDTSQSLSDSELDHAESYEQSCRQKSCDKNDMALVPTFKRSKSLNAENNFSRSETRSKIASNAILYVQMELCKYSLRKWLDDRNSTSGIVDAKSSTNIFKQILKGVQYLHSQDLMHRDLKPQNILFDSQDRVKIGDFGLATACCCFNSDNLRKTNRNHPFGHSQGVGTSPYSAPEVKNGTSYDTKADMYSLGVILLELFYPFGTAMERAIVMTNDLPKGKLPNEFRQKFPEQARVILDLTNSKPKLRPDATDVLNSQLFFSKTQVIAKQEAEIKSLKNEVVKLKARIKALEREKNYTIMS